MEINTPPTAEQELPNYDILRHQLKLLAKEFRACDSFLQDIDYIHCKVTFKRFLQREMENICDKLDIDGFNGHLEDDIDDLEDKIQDLESDNEELQEELDELKEKYGLGDNSLSEEYKCQFFCQYKNNYTEWELEELLKHGKSFLTNLRVA